MVIVNDEKLLAMNEEYSNLLRKLDKPTNYKTDEERQKDEQRVGEIENERRQYMRQYLSSMKLDIAKQVQKVVDMKEAKKLLKKKYEEYRQVTIKAREFVDECVEKKKEGRDLMERIVKSKGKTDKKLIDDILKF